MLVIGRKNMVADCPYALIISMTRVGFLPRLPNIWLKVIIYNDAGFLSGRVKYIP